MWVSVIKQRSQCEIYSLKHSSKTEKLVITEFIQLQYFNTDLLVGDMCIQIFLGSSFKSLSVTGTVQYFNFVAGYS